MSIINCVILRENILVDFRISEISDSVDLILFFELSRNGKSILNQRQLPVNAHRFIINIDNYDPVESESMILSEIKNQLSIRKTSDSDTVVITQCSEIPDTKALKVAATSGIKGAFRLHMDTYYHNILTKARISHSKSYILNFGFIRDHDFSALVNSPSFPLMGGWNLVGFGSGKSVEFEYGSDLILPSENRYLPNKWRDLNQGIFAFYGNNGRFIDVSAKILTMIRDGHILIPCGGMNALFGDPLPDIKKKLSLVISGVDYTISEYVDVEIKIPISQ